MLAVEPQIRRAEVETVDLVKRGGGLLASGLDGNRLQLAQSRVASGQKGQLAAILQQRLRQQRRARGSTVETDGKYLPAGIALMAIFATGSSMWRRRSVTRRSRDRVLHVVDALGFLEGDETVAVDAIGRVRLRSATAIVELEELMNRAVGRRPDGILPGGVLSIRKIQMVASLGMSDGSGGSGD